MSSEKSNADINSFWNLSNRFHLLFFGYYRHNGVILNRVPVHTFLKKRGIYVGVEVVSKKYNRLMIPDSTKRARRMTDSSEEF